MIKTKALLLLVLFVLFAISRAYSLTPKDLALIPNVRIFSDSNQIIVKINFARFPFDGTLSIKSKRPDFSYWEKVKRFDNPSQTYFDTIDINSEPIEYGIELENDSLFASGFVIVGNSKRIHWDNGLVLILVDQSLADSITAEIDSLRLAMACDGWGSQVERVPRSQSFNPLYVSKVKRLIQRYIDVYGNKLRAVLLLGRIPVPYSGNYTFDGHPDHFGAFPSDLFYVCDDCSWTDEGEFNISAKRTENWNAPFDGKFDQTSLDTLVRIAIGRIDFFDLPAFNHSEVELTKKYIAKNLAFRNGRLKKPFRALIDDGFGLDSKESFSTSAWLNFSILADSVVEGKFLENVTARDYLFAYGCNSGSYTSVWSVVDIDQARDNNLRVAFAFLFGSYLWDWDNENNLLRGILASDSMVIACGWMGRPYWHFHHLWLDEPFAFSLLRTYNNQFLYRSPGMFGYRGVHIEYFGDPTLKIYYPCRIENPKFYFDRQNHSVALKWEPPVDTVGFVGTIILKSKQKFMGYELITTNPVTEFEYIDKKPETGTSFYIFRPVYHFQTKFGNVLRLGLGKFIEVKTE